MRYWVCFSPAERSWARYLKPGFGHVSVIVKLVAGGFWVNPQENLEVGVMDGSRTDLAGSLKDLGYTVLEVVTDKTTSSRLLRPNVLTCVFMAKYILGIRVKGFTPWQLYQGLLETKDATVTQL